MNFGEALEIIKRGGHVRRRGWNGKHQHIYLWYPSIIDSGYGNFQPCIVIYTEQGKEQPGWLASQADMLAEDWEEMS